MISVGIVEDHPVFRHGLAGLVDDAEGLRLAFAVASIPELEAALAGGKRRPDVLILDLSLAGGGPQGVQAITYCVRLGRPTLIVSADATPSQVVAAMSAGAAGYVGKEAEAEEIVEAIRAVANGSTFLTPTLAGYLVDQAPSIKLTAREVQILRLVAAGEKDVDIAAELFISVNTVHSHLDRIRAKTGHHRRVDLTRFAIGRGLLPDSPEG